VCSDPFPGQGFQTTTHSESFPKRSMLPSRTTQHGHSSKQRRGCECWCGVLSACLQTTWHRHSAFQIVRPSVSSQRSPPPQSARSVAESTRKARRAHPDAGANPPRSGVSQKKCGSNAQPEKPNRPFALPDQRGQHLNKGAKAVTTFWKVTATRHNFRSINFRTDLDPRGPSGNLHQQG